MNPLDDKPGVVIASAEEVVAMEDAAAAELAELEESLEERTMDSLAGHIMTVFQENVDTRSTSGMEEKMMRSLRAYNGHYDPEDIARIQAVGGSKIYMNLTPTKARAAISWIRDIMMPAKENAWALEPTPVPDIPEETSALIMKEVEQYLQTPQESNIGAPPDKNVTAAAATKIKDTNMLQQDLEEAFRDEVYRLASKEVKKFESKIADQLAEVGWDDALSSFIEDFCVFPVAIMKGPIVAKKKVVSWEGGQPVVKKVYRYLNKRVSPLDIYPSASATTTQDGNLCEHLRMNRSELYKLIGTKGYKDEAIREVLDSSGEASNYHFLSTYVENEKSVEEYRGDAFRANKGMYHGIHYFGSASYSMLLDWGYPMEKLGTDESAEFEVEAVVVGSTVIKVKINDDPLLRRPYYKASFQNIPGSWWGRSLPERMRDIQRMCNATARALSNNMGVASGPQVEVYTDRLAADEEIEEMYPFKIWQAKSDPTGGSGRAVQFWQPSSNASELLGVYEKFELMADDATGIPRYAHGNERAQGAAATATGLSMLLESASKGIKDSIRHIDEGLIRPRIEYQFYMNMLSGKHNFTGDVAVVAKGSQALTMRGAQEMRRNEFLQILANQEYLQIVGVEGVADILREMAKGLGLGENIVPSRIELKQQQAERERAQQEQMKAEAEAAQQEQAVGVQQVQLQTQQAEQASQRTAQIKVMELEQNKEAKRNELLLKAHEIAQRQEEEKRKASTALLNSR